jgi:wyosine [tRNA(Phe)-imidazoG37] synthetase (radical SAM superfamily)
MTPVVTFCQNSCIFCWRNLEGTKKTMDNGVSKKHFKRHKKQWINSEKFLNNIAKALSP